MKRSRKLLALLLALVMGLSLLAGCGSNTNNTANNGGAANNTQTDDTQTPAEDPNETTPLVVATEQGLEGKFSPFFYLSNADNEVVSLTQLAQQVGADDVLCLNNISMTRNEGLVNQFSNIF